MRKSERSGLPRKNDDGFMRADLGACKEEEEVEHAKGGVGARAAAMLPTLKTAINLKITINQVGLEVGCKS